MRNEFTLCKRKAGNKSVFYYYAYDADGIRRRFTTGKTTKAAAMAYCMALAKAGHLIPASKDNELFGVFAKDFWTEGKSDYLKKEALRGRELSKPTLYRRISDVNNHILPYFKDMKLKEITKKKVENYMLHLAEQGLAPATINRFRIFLNIMLGYAVEQGYLLANPCAGVKPYIDRPKEKGILTPQEARELLFPGNIGTFWNNNQIAYAANMLAAVTGLRLNEVRALRREDIKDDETGNPYLFISHSYSMFGIKDTKNHKSRDIPIPGTIRDMLIELCPQGGGFIFSYNGKEPVPLYNIVYGGLFKALAAMGISKAEAKRRNITFHSWRHFYNTTLRAGNIADAKIRAITGHADEKMTDHYTHFTHNELADINKIQLEILGA
ncbi:MAG: tyrosine-type recombinase/integrase [Bacteroidales bacterium]|jgi:integrase|nr:tyrosine-type recombinase/integrase [Bacteroidales bacterium]